MTSMVHRGWRRLPVTGPPDEDFRAVYVGFGIPVLNSIFFDGQFRFYVALSQFNTVSESVIAIDDTNFDFLENFLDDLYIFSDHFLPPGLGKRRSFLGAIHIPLKTN